MQLLQELLSLLQDAKPHIVVHGHSHKYGVQRHAGVLFLNPGSAGPARFKLPRTAAVLELLPKVPVHPGAVQARRMELS